MGAAYWGRQEDPEMLFQTHPCIQERNVSIVVNLCYLGFSFTPRIDLAQARYPLGSLLINISFLFHEWIHVWVCGWLFHWTIQYAPPSSSPPTLNSFLQPVDPFSPCPLCTITVTPLVQATIISFFLFFNRAGSLLLLAERLARS